VQFAGLSRVMRQDGSAARFLVLKEKNWRNRLPRFPLGSAGNVIGEFPCSTCTFGRNRPSLACLRLQPQQGKLHQTRSWERIAAGNKLAMQALFARHRTSVYRWLLRFVSNETLVEDLLSEVFLDVWRQADRFEFRSSVSTWLLSIARYKALSARRRRTEEGAELDEKIEATIADPADNPEVALQEKDRDELLRRALTRLSPEHRQVIDLVYYHEKSVDEVPQILDVPAATVKTRMYARKKLAELVKGA
jgi:RNA polymerase sigma-70 factor, ECF subfamily